ncbi:hypothetical protein B0T14DRAFT_495906 [Immersiella caudata]|uniref:J domain-containing protein n=1 Tax=Immersiella caudata TaxID=314043 RepID=A0AA39WP90_9PEZI|nr:hypothetical protein B0T14DRAFT_495906 [Immersiella caudata]
MPFIDYYNALGVSPYAKTGEITQAYSKLALGSLNRPLLEDDSETDGKQSLKRFDIFRVAYAILTDVHKRSEFHSEWETQQMETFRKMHNIPKRIRDSLRDASAVSRTTALYWAVRLLVVIRRVTWFRLRKIEDYVMHHTLKVDPEVKHEFYRWVDDAERCMVRLIEVKHEIQSSKEDWYETSQDALNTAKELLLLDECCTAWLHVADRVIEWVEDMFDESMDFKKADSWADRTICEGRLCESILVWEIARFDEWKHLRRNPRKDGEKEAAKK